MSRACTKCNEVKELTEFNKNSRYADGFTRQCKSCMYKADRKRFAKREKLYYVYYLPEEHYCGMCKNLDTRMANHRHQFNRNTDNMKVFKVCKTKKEAIYYEALFCSTLGINGL